MSPPNSGSFQHFAGRAKDEFALAADGRGKEAK
jgi:hypothetical protein